MRPPVLLTLLFLAPGPLLHAQRDSLMAHRWVGIHLARPLELEFYDDTMLVVNDQHALDFRATNDSLVAVGDTTVIGRYRLVLGRLILETPDEVVTMAPQSTLARPLTGRWRGPLGMSDGATVELVIYASGTARWHRFPDGAWSDGEWDREARVVTFTWADDTEWQAQYDPEGNSLLFEQTVPDGGPTILRRAYR